MEEADAHHGEDDEWDESSPQDDGELEEQFGSLDTAQEFATTEMENAACEIRSAAQTFTDAKKFVSQVKSERGFFPLVGAGALRRLAISVTLFPMMVRMLLAKERELLHQHLVVIVTTKDKLIPDDIHLQSLLAHGPRSPLQSGQRLFCGVDRWSQFA